MLWLGPTSNQPTSGPRRKSIHIMDVRPSTVRRVSGVLLEVIDDVARGHLHRVQGVARSNRAAPTKAYKSADLVAEDHPIGFVFL